MEPLTTKLEIPAAALQFVRKPGGFNIPPKTSDSAMGATPLLVLAEVAQGRAAVRLPMADVTVIKCR